MSEVFDEVRRQKREELSGTDLLDAELFESTFDLFAEMPLPDFVDHTSNFLGPPSPLERLQISTGMRNLGASPYLYLVSPTGVISARLFTLVSVIESLVYPHLVAVSDVLKHREIVGTKSSEFEYSKRSLGRLCKFLDSKGHDYISSVAPKLENEIHWLVADRIPQFRNAISHASFRYELVKKDLNSIPEIEKVHPLTLEHGFDVTKKISKLLGVVWSENTPYVSYEESKIRYEEKLGKPLNRTSRTRSFSDVKAAVDRVEKLSFALAMAFMSVGSAHEETSGFRLGDCRRCGQGHMAGLVGHEVLCSFCGGKWVFE